MSNDKKESPEEVEISVEEYVSEGRPFPPHSHNIVYKFKVNKDIGKSNDPVVTGRYILESTGRKPAEDFILEQSFKHGIPKTLGYDESVDLTKAGIERFVAIDKKQREG